MRIKLLVGCMILVCTSCVEPFFPELGKYQNLLVIDGKLTNQSGPYIIRLNTSSDVYKIDYPPVTGAEVIISDDEGGSETLSEYEPGVYTTRTTQGVVGRKYKLNIHTPDGKDYETEFQELLEPTPIDSVYPEIAYRQDFDLPYDLGGYQFFLDGGTPAKTDNFYLWELEATYKYRSDYPLLYTYAGSLEEFPDPEMYRTCWTTAVIPEIFTFNTLGLSNPKINRLPLHFENTENKRLSIRYSLKVKQYNLTEDAYQFWDGIARQIANQGSLYAQQPYQIRGNLSNIDDPDEPVLGYFLVASISEKRIFVDPPEDVPFHVTKCNLVTDMLGFILQARGDWPFFLSETETGVLGIGEGACIDCRAAGGTIEQPDFWVD